MPLSNINNKIINTSIYSVLEHKKIELEKLSPFSFKTTQLFKAKNQYFFLAKREVTIFDSFTLNMMHKLCVFMCNSHCMNTYLIMLINACFNWSHPLFPSIMGVRFI